MTASEMFSIPLDQMTPEIRRRAKAINFGVIYGISAFGLANNLKISRDEAKTLSKPILRVFQKSEHIWSMQWGAKSNLYVKHLAVEFIPRLLI